MQDPFEGRPQRCDRAASHLIACVGLDVHAVHAPVLEGLRQQQELGGRVDGGAASSGGEPGGADLDGEEPTVRHPPGRQVGGVSDDAAGSDLHLGEGRVGTRVPAGQAAGHVVLDRLRRRHRGEGAGRGRLGGQLQPRHVLRRQRLQTHDAAFQHATGQDGGGGM